MNLDPKCRPTGQETVVVSVCGSGSVSVSVPCVNTVCENSVLIYSAVISVLFISYSNLI